MDISNLAISETQTTCVCSQRGLPQRSADLKRTVPMLFCFGGTCFAVLSLNLFHLNISFDYELSKVQKGFNRWAFILFQMAWDRRSRCLADGLCDMLLWPSALWGMSCRAEKQFLCLRGQSTSEIQATQTATAWHRHERGQYSVVTNNTSHHVYHFSWLPSGGGIPPMEKREQERA